MIRQSTIQTLCEEAGLDPSRVFHAEVTPCWVTFKVYSVDIYGKLQMNATRDGIVSSWVRAAIA